jgi:hypothetical protein
MIPPVWKIEGPFAGVNEDLIFLAVAVTVVVIALTAAVAHQLARIQPKPAKLAAAARSTGEFDTWTERPKTAPRPDEYYARYGSQPAPPNSYVSPRAPPAPPPPLGEVVVNLGGAPVQEEGWVDAATPAAPFSPPPLRAPPQPTGPTDEVVAPSHARRGRDTATGMLPSEESPAPPFDRSSHVPGAITSAAPAPLPPPPVLARPAGEKFSAPAPQPLPEATRAAAATRGAFREPAQAPSVVGTATTGAKEGELLTPGKKAIRCPKCATVFAGPETRPATVKCPACGTTGVLK